MKDIYELLNDMEVETDLEEWAPVSEVEEKKVLRKLNQQIIKEKKLNKWKKTLSAAMVTFGIMLSALVGLSFTTYADDLPFLGNIFNFFSNDGSYEGYEEQAEKLDLTEESNGVTISIDDTVFDGKSLYITYTIETNKELGDSPWINGMPVLGDSHQSGTEKSSKVEDGKYIGMMEVNRSNQQEIEEADVNWTIGSISTEPNNEGTVVEGDWEFQFHVNAVESQIITLDERIDEGDVKFTAEKIIITPMSILLSYDHVVSEEIMDNWDSHSAIVEITDDLGNDYSLVSLAGTSNVSHSLNWNATFTRVDSDATKLILTPIIELSDYETIGYDENGDPIKADYRLIDSDADYEEIQLEEIIVELE